jgi:hypothetical protein
MTDRRCADRLETGDAAAEFTAIHIPVRKFQTKF